MSELQGPSSGHLFITSALALGMLAMVHCCFCRSAYSSEIALSLSAHGCHPKESRSLGCRCQGPDHRKLWAFQWSSYGEYLKGPRQRWPWLRVDRLLAEHGIPRDSPAGRAEFETRMELRRAMEDGLESKPILRGWCLGSEAFRKELLAQMSEQRGAEHYGQEIRESAEEKAERIARQELEKLGWAEGDLKQQRKGHPKKVAIASCLRRETTMTLGWIAQRLNMGTQTHLSHLLYWQARDYQKARSRGYNDFRVSGQR